MDNEKLCSACQRKIFRKGYGAVQTTQTLLCIFCACRKLKEASRESALISLVAKKGGRRE